MEIDSEHDRYHRQSLITWWDQSLLSSATMLVVGAGALGNEIVKNLALMGMGRILVTDMDRIESSNLARCAFFRPEDAGSYKADVLAMRVSELNPEVEVIAIPTDVRLGVGLGVFAECDVVLGGLDNREARLFVNEACWKTTTPWVDGAIEGLMGVVRVFMPPDSPCYECTLSARDHELMAARRTCTMLTRQEMLSGKTPTTATSASVVAGMQAQEAIKLLHIERLGVPTLAGGGFQFVGLTHESYVIRYARREDCVSHDTYELADATQVAHDVRFGELLSLARSDVGGEAILDLEHEIVLGASCSQCGCKQTILQPVEALNAGAGLCGECGNPWKLELAHSIDDGSPLLGCAAVEVGLPPGDIVVARKGLERRFYSLTGPDSAIALLRQAVRS